MSHTTLMGAVESFSNVDRAWWLMERPTNPMMVIGLLVLAGPLRRERVRSLILERFLPFERFRCYLEADNLGARWIPSTHFDIDDHVLCAALPAGAGQHELEQLVGELASTPLTPSRPLWTFHVVEHYLTGSALIVRIHHSYADGIALVRVLLRLTDNEPQGPSGRRPVSRHADSSAQSAGLPQATESTLPAHEVTSSDDLLSHWLTPMLREGVGLLEKSIHYALHPSVASASAREVLGFASEILHLAAQTDDPPTRLKQPLCGNKRVSWAKPLSLEEVKTIGQVLGCTVNDVLVSTLAGALGRYLQAQGENVAGLTIRATVPVNLRPPEEPLSLGNRFGLVFLELPIGIRHPLERLYAVRTMMLALKSSPQALATLGLLGVVGALPTAAAEVAIALFSAKASLVASNLRGPARPLRIAGVRVRQVLFWVPQSGSIGIGVSMLTYNGQVQFGVIADRQLIPDPAALVELITTEFERLIFLVLLGAGSLTD